MGRRERGRNVGGGTESSHVFVSVFASFIRVKDPPRRERDPRRRAQVSWGKRRKMMLPGVELARKRRVHHHEIMGRGPPGPSLRPSLQRTAMDASALLARERLEEKLRGFSPPSSTSRWSKHVGDEGESSGQGVILRAKPRTRSGVLERRMSSENEVCTVCLNEVRAQERVMSLPCSHKYHTDCLLPWLTAHSNCPSCRTLVPL